MYEPTAKGAWFKWGALDRREKWLAGTSFAAFGGGLLLVMPLMGFGETAYRIGYRLGSGGRDPRPGEVAERVMAFGPGSDFTALAGALLIGIGILLWTLFSRKQDELFNRVQNRSYGFGSFITIGVMALWLLIERVAAIGGPTVEGVSLIWVVACSIVWLVDARRLWR